MLYFTASLPSPLRLHQPRHLLPSLSPSLSYFISYNVLSTACNLITPLINLASTVTQNKSDLICILHTIPKKTSFVWYHAPTYICRNRQEILCIEKNLIIHVCFYAVIAFAPGADESELLFLLLHHNSSLENGMWIILIVFQSDLV